MPRKIETIREMKIGNTTSSQHVKKQENQLKFWCFTYNNYDVIDIPIIETKLKELCTKYVFQRERGEENDTPHLQGSIWLKKAMRFSEFKLMKKIHWEKMNNEEACIRYCQKAETAEGEPYLFGFRRPVKIIEKLRPYQKFLEDIYLTEPDPRAIYWIYEPIGGVGKSEFCKYMNIKHGATFCNGKKTSDLLNMVYNANLINEVKLVIWDIPRKTGGVIDYEALEPIKNGLICNTKYETGCVAMNAPHVFVFCNFPPEQTYYLSSDRWHIYKINLLFELERVFVDDL